MKTRLIIAATLLLGMTLSCNKVTTCEHSDLTCNEQVPTDELCEASFERWFFNADKNTCEKIGYSGCSEKGFATEAECQSCICVSINK